MNKRDTTAETTETTETTETDSTEIALLSAVVVSETEEQPEERRLSATGNRSYDSHVRRYNQWLDRSGQTLTAESVAGHLKWMALQGYSASTICVAKVALKRAVRDGVFDSRMLAAIEQAFKTIKTPTVDSRVYAEDVIEEDQVKTLIDGSPEWLAIIIEALWKTGLRISELATARIDKCTVTPEVVYLTVTGKGSKERRVFLPPELYQRIRARWPDSRVYLMETSHGNQYHKSFLHREVQRIGWKLINRAIHPHQFRHSFATLAIRRKSGSTKAVSLYLGHASVATTEGMYNHDSLTPDDIAEVFGRP